MAGYLEFPSLLKRRLEDPVLQPLGVDVVGVLLRASDKKPALGQPQVNIKPVVFTYDATQVGWTGYLVFR